MIDIDWQWWGCGAICSGIFLTVSIVAGAIASIVILVMKHLVF